MNSSEDWQPSRLMPVSGLNAADEQERRGTSALLAVMQAVSEYGKAVLQYFNAPNGNIETFIEVPFELGGKKYRPDGLIRIRRGAKTWVALVEVKTLRNKLDDAQVSAYLEIAKQEGFDAVITISNELASVGGAHPLTLDRRTTKKVELHHISWSLLHHDALVLFKSGAIKDKQRNWILGEFIRYLEYPKSGAIDFDDMGQSWVTVREAAIASTLRANDTSTLDVVDHYSQLMRYVAMNLSSKLGVKVNRVLKRADRENPRDFLSRMAYELARSGRMTGQIDIPNAAAPIEITADLRAGRIFCSLILGAPLSGRPATKVSWLLRQLRESPRDLLLSVNGPRARDVGPTLRLEKAIERPDLLLAGVNFEIRSFSISIGGTAGSKRGQGKNSFVDSVISLVDSFYGSTVQNLKAFVPPAPKVIANETVPSRPDEGRAAEGEADAKTNVDSLDEETSTPVED